MSKILNRSSTLNPGHVAIGADVRVAGTNGDVDRANGLYPGLGSWRDWIGFVEER